MEILSIQDLSFAYPGGKKVVNNLSMKIEQGEFVVLFGKTGCGKSTLFKLIKKELTPNGTEEGKIRFRGVEKSDLSLRASAEGIGFVMQSPENQIVTDKVWHELSFYMENLGYPSERIAARVGELSNYFGITPWFRKDTVRLSGGQKQLLTLASVMTVAPSLLILDEPTSRLDPIAAKEFLGTLKRLNTELGLTVLLSEHRLEDVLPCADKLAVMSEGKISYFGAPKDVCGQLSQTNFLSAMPSAVKIWRGTGEKGDLPLSVKEGRNYLSSLVKNSDLRPIPPAEEGESVLKMKNVWFRYEKEDSDVLKGAEVSVKKGEIFGIVGGNGSGKSTALKLFAALKKPYRGKVLLEGKNVNKIKKNELYGGLLVYLPQDPASVFLSDTVGAELGKGHEDVIRKMGIENLLERHPNDLSGGEQQKCAIAKLLTLDPKILLLDEPTKGLDCFAKEELVSLIKELKGDRTIVIVTHDVEFAALACDRCSLLFDGEFLPPAHPRAFFSENNFYTTSASRIARGMVEGAVTCEDILSCYEHKV